LLQQATPIIDPISTRRSKIDPVTDTIFLKLGGSVITDKTRRYSARLESLERLAREIHSVLVSKRDLHLVIGHGSGSFGHFAVKESLAPYPYPPPESADPRGLLDYWRGFAEVWYRASQLNRYVVDALHAAEIPLIAFAPSAMAMADSGKIKSWDTTSIKKALECGLVPVIYGDIAFDAIKGGTILSTETLMFHLAQQLHPKTILLAGLEAAVWADFPARQQRIEKITANGFNALSARIGGSRGTDVTGGMRSKVEEMLRLVRQIPDLTVQIFSGEEAGNVEDALKGRILGTLITSD
jgi:isopentenyl phosphate kinase